MYIIDSSFLINLHREIPFNSKDELWVLILELAKNDYLKLPEKVIEELERGSDNLAVWAHNNKKILCLKTDEIFEFLPEVLTKYQEGQENFPLTDLDFLESIADPYVIAQALKLHATVVSGERPCLGNYLTQRPKNRKIPDICAACSIDYMNGTKFLVQIAKLLK